MNKARLIKRGEAQPERPIKPIPKAVTIQKTVAVVKGWLGTRHQHTTQSAREAFSSLFAPTQEPCSEC